MGVSIYLSLQKDIAGVDPLAIDGKLLAQAQDTLDDFAERAGLKTIAEMTSFSDEELDDFFDDEAEMPMNEEQWFAAADGLATVRAMLVQLRAHPNFVPRSKDVIEDLAAIEAVLLAAEQAHVRFHFSIDF